MSWSNNPGWKDFGIPVPAHHAGQEELLLQPATEKLDPLLGQTMLSEGNDTISRFDWCCFYCFLRNSLVALLEALFARIFLDLRYRCAEIFLFFLLGLSPTKPLPPLLPTRLLCLVVAIPLVCWLYMCAYVCVPLYVHVKMCRWSDKYLADISKTVTTSRAVLW